MNVIEKNALVAKGYVFADGTPTADGIGYFPAKAGGGYDSTPVHVGVEVKLVEAGTPASHATVMWRPEIVLSHYVPGSEGHRNLFLREQGDVYEVKGWGEDVAPTSQWIIQWGGSRRYDSGYAADHFPPTPEGRTAAYRAMCEYQLHDSH
jgi:hypothetical protein